MMPIEVLVGFSAGVPCCQRTIGDHMPARFSRHQPQRIVTSIVLHRFDVVSINEAELSAICTSPVDLPPMPSPTAPSPLSPITQLSYDVLLEIFTHCLPRRPLFLRQPKTTIAPLLLCHICASWRQLALASTTLWTHLSYKLTAVEMHSSAPGPSSVTIEFRDSNMEFIRWWKEKHGQVPPFLAFKMNWSHCATVLHQEPTNTSQAFQLDYITSAQYLELDAFFWEWLLVQYKAGHPLVFPNLHTAREADTDRNSRLHQLQTLLSPHAFPALRRVSFSEYNKIRVPYDNATPPAHWTALTHISLSFALMLPLWRTLLRALPQLRWGYFEMVPGMLPLPLDDSVPAECTLPDLQTLSLVVCGTAAGPVFPLHLLFAALRLPALRTLALSVPGAIAWTDGLALAELYAVLASTPGITTLVLEDQNFGARPEPPPALHTAETVWAHAPHLAHIQLALPNDRTPHHARHSQVVAFVRGIFADNTWLDLRNAACPIREVTISNGEVFVWTGELMMTSVREMALEVPCVSLRFTDESVSSAAADAVKEWGARM